MTEPAQNYQTIESATTTEGLEDLFIVSDSSSESVAGPTQEEDAGPSQYVSALEAAKILGINKRSVLRLIQEQKLDAVKEHGKYLIEWKIVEQRKQAMIVAGPSRDEGPAEYVSVDIEDVGPAQLNVRSSRDEVPSQDICDDSSKRVLDAHKLLKELEAATYRIGYLESQLSERQKDLESQREQIKLLTDSQHKTSWWARFTKWCAGQ